MHALLSSLEGDVVTDASVYGDDFGNLARAERPLAVFRPSSADAVAGVLALARAHGFRVVARGAGHTTGGQSLARDGVVLDMRYLRAIRELAPDSVWVGAGSRWNDVAHAVHACGSLPPVLTGYLGLSVGGTLSVGGIGLRSFRVGAQTDNVLELDVVTGTGERIVCSPRHAPRLFDACRAGLGQFGVIVGAKLRLVDAPSRVHGYDIVYSDARACLAEQERLLAEGRFDEVGSMVVWLDGRWQFLLQLALDGPERADPDVREAEHTDYSCLEFIDRVELRANAMKQFGLWDAPHPWANFFLPACAMPEFLDEFARVVTEPDLGNGPIGLYPLRRAAFQTPFLALPRDEVIYLVAVLPNAFPLSREHTQRLLALADWQYQLCADLGGTIYPIGILPSASQRRSDLAPVWDAWLAAQAEFDPHRLLAPHGKQSA